MSANLELAKQRGVSQENIEAINALHELLEKLIQSYTLDVPYQEARDLVRSANITLSSLWGFTYDERFDIWSTRFNRRWLELAFAGRTFECGVTGEKRTIKSEDCYECSFVPIGNSFLDMGVAGGYHRVLGNLKEIV